MRTPVEKLKGGDVLVLPDRQVHIEGLVPPTEEATLAYGWREVRSGSWWQTYEAGELVDAIRREDLPKAAETAERWCEYVDVLDEGPPMRVTDHPECPVHAEQPPGAES